jgi:hypothetical protein
VNLPNYFLADLPPEAILSPAMITEACQTLKRNRERHLAHRTTHNLVHVLAEVAKGWLQTDNRFRKFALESGPAETGFSRATLAKGLDNFFRQFTPENLQALLVQDLGGDSCHVSHVTRHDSRHPSPVTRHFRFPPWARVQIISPETGREVADGETGLIRVFDLANVFSVMAIQTQDLGVRCGKGFELIGRAQLAEQRGCSLMTA